MGFLSNLVEEFPCLARRVLYFACDFLLQLFDRRAKFREMTCFCYRMLYEILDHPNADRRSSTFSMISTASRLWNSAMDNKLDPYYGYAYFGELILLISRSLGVHLPCLKRHVDQRLCLSPWPFCSSQHFLLFSPSFPRRLPTAGNKCRLVGGVLFQSYVLYCTTCQNVKRPQFNHLVLWSSCLCLLFVFSSGKLVTTAQARATGATPSLSSSAILVFRLKR